MVALSQTPCYNYTFNRYNMAKMVDLTNKTYGDWKILKRNGSDNSGFVLWLAQCKCGKQKKFRSNQITSYRAKKNCGCNNSWIGQKFGKLTVLEKIGEKGNHASYLICQCECGMKKEIWGSSLHSGHIISCGCFRNRNEVHIAIVTLMSSYKDKAKKKNVEFKLTHDEFKEISQKKCHYCNSLPSNELKKKSTSKGIVHYIYNGIDRYDNDKGYTIENVVPCCKKCNLMKRDMDFNTWVEQMKKIIANQLNVQQGGQNAL